jgi:transcriptional regulator with XRE-family HTH domain
MNPTPCESSGECFARNLRAARELSGHAVQSAAAIVGVATSTWSQWESGKRTPSFAMLDRIARAFGMSPAHLLSCDPESAEGD